MEDQRQQTAIAALEVVLRGLLECESSDTLKILTVAADGVPTVRGFSVTRRLVETDGEVTAYFLGERPLEIQGRLCLIGDYFISAANRFLQEILEPRFNSRGISVGKLLAGSREINLERSLFDAVSHNEAERRLYPPRES